ncbi:MAG: (2Fe-2S)-binding protein [Gemmatimonadetes bacterium]|nr:(2Fe-2S)-binding protein [Gemmatimonadota bacterium]
MKIELRVNDRDVSWDCEPHEFLTEVLRRNGLTGTKRGCESGDCGACAVMLDGREAPSCIVLAAQAAGHEITTIESIGSFEAPHAIQEAFVDRTAIQCGYCTPGMVIAAKALIDRNPAPSEREVRRHLAGHVCRCTGHVKPVAAVLEAARGMEGES